MTSKIRSVHAREVFDIRNIPALEVDVILEDRSLGRAIAPSGTSRGANESFDLRDGDQSYFKGMGVWKAIENVNLEIDKKLRGNDATDQEHIDRLMIELDGTSNKSRLGGNAIIATSIANAKAAAQSLGIPLFEHLGEGREIPLTWFMVMIGGPIYAGKDIKTSDIQEFAYYALNSRSYREGYTMTLEVYQALREILDKEKGYTLPRLGGGWLAPTFYSNDDALSTMTKAIEKAGYSPGKDFAIYLDVASTHFYKNGRYHLKADNKVLTSQEMVDYLEDMCNIYPIVSIEDGLSEEDWEGWKLLTKRIGHKTQLVGDDIFATNPQRLKKGIEMGLANAIVIKPNQIGTVTETIQTIRLAKAAGYGTVPSARSGEIGDPFLSHLVVGQALGEGKLASFDGEEHVRLNELLRIEEYLGSDGTYAGRKVLSRFLHK
ncbi:MAG: phosphopyruvate hydratase [Nitrososphaeria archaeon]